MKKYSIIDIETTGGSRNNHKITEIAIINLDGDKVVETFSTLINPEKRIPLNITYLTGITNEMVEHSPKFYEVAKKIVQMTEGRIFVAHNVFFDYNFIKHEFSELGFQFKREKLCTVRLGRKYLPGHKSYSLGKLCADLEIEIENRHRAMGDAMATVILFKKILSKVVDSDFIGDEAKKIPLPPYLERNHFDQLPEKTGVYYFFNEKDELLYVGKSKNIKKRVAQHFRPDIKRKKDILLKNSIAKIEYKLLGHELAALLFECQQIKEKWPPFNTSLKSKKFTYGVKLLEDKRGVLYPKIFSSIDPEGYIYQFKNKHSAQKKIDALYKSILGDLSLLESIDNKVDQMVTVLGVEGYNKIIEKTFYFNVPKLSDFTLKLDQSCFLKVQNKRPVEIQYYEGSDIKEKIPLMDDPQMRGILWSFLVKEKNTKIIETDFTGGYGY